MGEFAARVQASAKWTLIGRVLNVACGFLLHLLAIRLLGMDQYGTVLTSLAVAFLLSKLSLFGLPALLVRETRANSGDKILYRRILLLVSLVTSVVCVGYIAAPYFSFTFSSSEKPPALIIVWVISLVIGNFFADVFRVRDEFLWANLVGGATGGLATTLLQLAGVAACFLFSSIAPIHVEIILAGSAFAVAIIAVIRFLFLSEAAVGDSEPEKAPPNYGWLLIEALPIMIVELVVMGHQHIEALVLDARLSVGAVAIFGTSRRLTTLVSFPLLLVNTSIRPFVARAYRSRRGKDFEKLVRVSATVGLAIALPMFLTTYVFAPQLLGILFQPAFAAGAPVLRLLTLASIVFVALGSSGLVLQMTGRQNLTMWITLTSLVIYLLVAPALMSRYGLVGAGIAAVIQIVFNNVGCMLAAKISVGVSTYATANIGTMRRVFFSVLGSGK